LQSKDGGESRDRNLTGLITPKSRFQGARRLLNDGCL
jgi:hypothetical protein